MYENVLIALTCLCSIYLHIFGRQFDKDISSVFSLAEIVDENVLYVFIILQIKFDVIRHDIFACTQKLIISRYLRILRSYSTPFSQWRGERYDSTSTRTGPLQSEKLKIER